MSGDRSIVEELLTRGADQSLKESNKIVLTLDRLILAERIANAFISQLDIYIYIYIYIF